MTESKQAVVVMTWATVNAELFQKRYEQRPSSQYLEERPELLVVSADYSASKEIEKLIERKVGFATYGVSFHAFTFHFDVIQPEYIPALQEQFTLLYAQKFDEIQPLWEGDNVLGKSLRRPSQKGTPAKDAPGVI